MQPKVTCYKIPFTTQSATALHSSILACLVTSTPTHQSNIDRPTFPSINHIDRQSTRGGWGALVCTVGPHGSPNPPTGGAVKTQAPGRPLPLPSVRACNMRIKHESEKKKKHLGACIEQRRHFSPFVVSLRTVSSAKKPRSC
jgi:hypothetical protein